MRSQRTEYFCFVFCVLFHIHYTSRQAKKRIRWIESWSLYEADRNCNGQSGFVITCVDHIRFFRCNLFFSEIFLSCIKFCRMGRLGPFVALKSSNCVNVLKKIPREKNPIFHMGKSKLSLQNLNLMQ